VVLAVPEEDWTRDLADALHRAGYLPHRAPSPETASLAVTYRNPNAVLIDASFIETAGYRFFDSMRIAAPGVPLIVMADAEDEQLRLKSLMLGAEDCLVRPFAPQEAVLRVRRALERKNALGELKSKKTAADQRSERDRTDLGALRAQMRRSVTLLQRAVDFHQRLEPDGDEGTLHAMFLRHLSVQIGVDAGVSLRGHGFAHRGRSLECLSRSSPRAGNRGHRRIHRLRSLALEGRAHGGAPSG
jgi:DNA-binding response OmpR family regulator